MKPRVRRAPSTTLGWSTLVVVALAACSGGGGAAAPSSVATTVPSVEVPGVSIQVIEPVTTASRTSVADATTTTVEVEAPTLSSVPVAPEAAPARVVIDGGSVFLRGSVPDQAAEESLVQRMTLLFGKVVTELDVDPSVAATTDVPLFVPSAALFTADSALLSSAAAPVLDVVAQALQRQDTARLSIRGHTDDQGSEAYNFALSQQRVAAVFAYLRDHGVDPARMELDPRGETEPIADNSTLDGRRLNRRVELVLSTT